MLGDRAVAGERDDRSGERSPVRAGDLDASDAERRRIAASLHDGVVQQLVAASFTAAGQAQRARSGDDQQLAADLDGAASAVRDSIAGLRSLLVDIYPPSLHAAGLASTLHDLADPASRGAGPVPEIDARSTPGWRIPCQPRGGDVPDRPGSGPQRGPPRSRRAPHPAASGRAGRLHPCGHFGLRLMAEAARAGGGWLGVRSTPGTGTLVRYEVGAG